jgi:hypothetical protein
MRRLLAAAGRRRQGGGGSFARGHLWPCSLRQAHSRLLPAQAWLPLSFAARFKEVTHTVV